MSEPALNMSAATKALAPVIQPLTDREVERAIEAVTTALRGNLSDKYRVMGTELRIQKPAVQETPERLIGVYVVDYLNNRSIEALVNSRGEVIVKDLPPYQLPISAAEVREAQNLALQDERVAEALGPRQGVFVSPCSPSSDDDGTERLICLHYFRSDSPRVASPVPIGDVEVNLGNNEVRFNPVELEDE